MKENNKEELKKSILSQSRKPIMERVNEILQIDQSVL